MSRSTTSTTLAGALLLLGSLAAPIPPAQAAPAPQHPVHPPPVEEPEEPEEPDGEPSHQHPPTHAGHLSDEHEMPALFGPYGGSREASGTSWQPEAAPHEGLMGTRGPWSWMAHGRAHVVSTDQPGPRGDEELYSVNMAMASARRQAGPGTLGVRAMLSLEPATVGREGYPLLLQTGETADGETELVDRQHPHDLFMELAGSYSLPLGTDSSAFVYVGLPGEPALGPPAFPHRFSSFENPEAPLPHHWLDSTHIAFGVVTLGWVRGAVKIEGSTFRGREPDEDRWDIESPSFDSWSARVSYNPTRRWALQASHGYLQGPEQLAPDEDVDRTTVSAMYHGELRGGEWQATLAWGRNDASPGGSLDAWLLEATTRLVERHTLFGRAEWTENGELLGHHDEEGEESPIFRVGALSAGYLYDFLRRGPVVLGAGTLARVSFVPRELEAEYGSRTPFSWGVMLRAAVQ